MFLLGASHVTSKRLSHFFSAAIWPWPWGATSCLSHSCEDWVQGPKKMKIIQNTFGGVKCASKFTIFQHLQTLYSKTYYITMDLTSFTPVQKSPWKMCSIWGFKQSLLDNGFKPRGMQVRLESFLGRLKLERNTSIFCIERNKSLTRLTMDMAGMVPTMALGTPAARAADDWRTSAAHFAVIVSTPATSINDMIIEKIYSRTLVCRAYFGQS